MLDLDTTIKLAGQIMDVTSPEVEDVIEGTLRKYNLPDTTINRQVLSSSIKVAIFLLIEDGKLILVRREA